MEESFFLIFFFGRVKKKYWNRARFAFSLSARKRGASRVCASSKPYICIGGSIKPGKVIACTTLSGEGGGERLTYKRLDAKYIDSAASGVKRAKSIV